MFKYHNSEFVDCTQTQTISSIQQLLEQMSELQLEERHERRDSERRIMDILEKLADQNARVNHLESADSELKKDVDNIADRLRQAEAAVLETDPRTDKLYLLYSMTTNKYAITLYLLFLSFVVTDILVNLSEHGPAIVKVFKSVLNLI